MEGSLRIFFANSGNDRAKSVFAPRKIINSRASAFRVASELPAEGDKIEFLASGCNNCSALQQYFDTGSLSGEAFTSEPADAINDLRAWDIPWALWPVSLKLMVASQDWCEAVGSNVKDGIVRALEDWQAKNLTKPLELSIHMYPDTSRVNVRRVGKSSSGSGEPANALATDGWEEAEADLPKASAELKKQVAACLPGLQLEWKILWRSERGVPFYCHGLSLKPCVFPSKTRPVSYK